MPATNPPTQDVAYRYTLTRLIQLDFDQVSKGVVVFVMLNPSTADDQKDDPTIRRCKGFARTWGYSTLRVVNLFAARATKPADLETMPDPVGPGNDEVLVAETAIADLVVAAWGTHGGFRGRADEVLRRMDRVQWWCLGVTKNGYPRHPLYVAADKKLEVYR